MISLDWDGFWSMACFNPLPSSSRRVVGVGRACATVVVGGVGLGRGDDVDEVVGDVVAVVVGGGVVVSWGFRDTAVGEGRGARDVRGWTFFVGLGGGVLLLLLLLLAVVRSSRVGSSHEAKEWDVLVLFSGVDVVVDGGEDDDTVDFS